MSLYIPSFSEILAVAQSRGADSCAPHLWPGLRLLLPMQEGGGTTAFDVSGYGNHGTLTSMDPATDWVVGEKGRCLDFDGTDDRIPLDDSLPGSGDWTCISWAKTASSFSGDAAQRMIFGSSASGSNKGRIYLGHDSSGVYYARAGDSNDIGSTSLSVNTWHHMGLQIDAGTARCFLDGRQDGSEASVDWVLSDNQRFGFASRKDGADSHWQGRACLAGIWCRALAPSEIQQLYAEPHCMVTLRRKVFPAVSAGGDITGNAAQTLAALTQAATGAVEVSGDAAQALPAITQAASGAVEVAGEAAQALPALTQAAAGAVEVAGDAAQTLPAIAQSASGAVEVAGGAAQVLPAITQSASGKSEIAGNAAQTLPAVQQAATGTTAASGDAAQALPAIQQAAAGEVPVEGDGSQTLPAIQQEAAGGVEVSGDAAQMLPAIQQAATGYEPTAGPFRVAAGQVYSPGAIAGQVSAAGAVAGQVFSAGAVAGQLSA